MNVNSNSNFLSNLVKSCEEGSLIREDGQALTVIDRIRIFFVSFFYKDNPSQLLLVSKKLNQSIENHTIQHISYDEKISILLRMRGISEKLKEPETKRELIKFVDNFNQIVVNYSKPIDSSTLNENIERLYGKNSKRNQLFNIQKLEFILSHNQLQAENLIMIADSIGSKHIQALQKNQKINSDIDLVILEKILANLEERLQGSEAYSQEIIECYFQVLRPYLEIQANKASPIKADTQNQLSQHLDVLKTLNSKYQNHSEFASLQLKHINSFLDHTFFNVDLSQRQLNTLSLNKEHGFYVPDKKPKQDIFAFKDFFALANQNIPLLETANPEHVRLASEIKIKFANLPCPGHRTSFPHLYLSEKAQLGLLIQGFQEKEDVIVNQLVTYLESQNIAAGDFPALVKMVGSSTPLSAENRAKIQQALSQRLNDHTSISWDDTEEVMQGLRYQFSLNQGKTDLIQILKRTSKGKQFFIDQQRLPEDQISIPQWYHTTSQKATTGIIETGEIKVFHKKHFKGVWVSDRVEQMGGYVLALSQRIQQIDPQVKIGYSFPSRKWRGLQKSVSLSSRTESDNLMIVGIPKQLDKQAQKIEKLDLANKLKEANVKHPIIYSKDQVEFMQQEVVRLLGTPNLSDRWWGEGQFYSEHQLSLHEAIKSQSIDPTLFEPKTDPENQMAISQIVQQFIVPFYKIPTPQNPSYQEAKSQKRVEMLSVSDKTYQERLDKVANQQEPARLMHGTMHAVRVVLWTEFLRQIYEQFLGQKRLNPMTLATAAGLHDAAREGEGPDRWDAESAELLKTFLSKAQLSDSVIDEHVQSIEEKDPKDKIFSSTTQQIVHDADCLEIIRIVGKNHFKSKELCFYHFDPAKKKFCDQFIDEVAEFIKLTEKLDVKIYLENHSSDFYGDLVRILFHLPEEFTTTKFTTLKTLMQQNSEGIYSTETEASRQAIRLMTDR